MHGLAKTEMFFIARGVQRWWGERGDGTLASKAGWHPKSSMGKIKMLQPDASSDIARLLT